MLDTEAQVDLYFRWEDALNEPEPDISLIASLEAEASKHDINLWELNNLMLNSYTAAVRYGATDWNPVLHPRGRDGRFIELLSRVNLFDFPNERGVMERGTARGTVREIRPARGWRRGKPNEVDILVELDDGRVLTVKPYHLAAAPEEVGRLNMLNRPKGQPTKTGRVLKNIGPAIDDLVGLGYSKLMRSAYPEAWEPEIERYRGRLRTRFAASGYTDAALDDMARAIFDDHLLAGGDLQAFIAVIDWNPDLHPRGRDGKFIEVLGLVRLFDFQDRKGNRHAEGTGHVRAIHPTDQKGNPDIMVEMPDGDVLRLKPNQIESGEEVKAQLDVDVDSPDMARVRREDRREFLTEPGNEDIQNRYADYRRDQLMRGTDGRDIADIVEWDEMGQPSPATGGSEAPEVPEARDLGHEPGRGWSSTREVGNLMKGDEVILPGDIPGVVEDFEFSEADPAGISIITDNGVYHGKTTDLLPSRRGNEIYPLPDDGKNPLGLDPDVPEGEPGSSRENPIKTDDPLEAVKALREGKFVELESVDQVATLIDELAEIARESMEKGQMAEDHDLCLVSVPGTNLFCAENKGIPRIEMPQLNGVPLPGSPADQLPKNPLHRGKVDLSEEFTNYLRSIGVDVTSERRLASHLKATQNELVGENVGQMVASMKAGKQDSIDFIRNTPIFVTKDGYVIDGHHRWAAVVGLDSMEGPIDELDMPVNVIDMDIMDVLKEAHSFAERMGLPTEAGVKKK